MDDIDNLSSINNIEEDQENRRRDFYSLNNSIIWEFLSFNQYLNDGEIKYGL